MSDSQSQRDYSDSSSGTTSKDLSSSQIRVVSALPSKEEKEKENISSSFLTKGCMLKEPNMKLELLLF